MRQNSVKLRQPLIFKKRPLFQVGKRVGNAVKSTFVGILQEITTVFDSLIPCSMKDWNACKIRRSSLFRFLQKTKGTEKEQANQRKGENILNIFFLFRCEVF